MPERPMADPDGRFDEEYQRNWLPVFRFALGWTNDWSAAEDLAQDAFARLWARRRKTDWSKPMLPWLMTTTRHLATDRFRRLRRAALLATSGGHESALDSDARLRWLDVRAAMAVLTPVQRSALVLTAVIGVDSETAAQVLDTTPGAVRAAASRARSRLAES
jgi:RNA polymerase sigma-70 factor (ECF subfamily)